MLRFLSVDRPVPDWLQALRAQANCPPRRPRVPLIVGAGAAGSALGFMAGSLKPDFLDQIGFSRSNSGGRLLLKKEHSTETGECIGWLLDGDVTEGLNRVATALYQAGLAGAWRQEQLAVRDARGLRVGSIERAAVRPLGIATRAAHLLEQAPDGRFRVQQRALD